MMIMEVLPQKLITPIGSYSLVVEQELHLSTIYYTNDTTGKVLPLLTNTTDVVDNFNSSIICSFLKLLVAQGVSAMSEGTHIDLNYYLRRLDDEHRDIRRIEKPNT